MLSAKQLNPQRYKNGDTLVKLQVEIQKDM